MSSKGGALSGVRRSGGVDRKQTAPGGVWIGCEERERVPALKRKSGDRRMTLKRLLGAKGEGGGAE